MISILTNGLNKAYSTSPEYADALLENASKNSNQDELIKSASEKLECINKFLVKIHNERNVVYPFSKEIYGVASRNYKLQIPILIIISGFVKHLLDRSIDIYNDDIFDKLMSAITQTLSNSYLEEGFKGSNTRPSIMKSTLDDMISQFES